MGKEVANKKGTIIFDMGKVILPFDYRIAFQKLEDKFELSEESILKNIFDSGLENDFEAGKITGHQFFKISCESLNITCDSESFRKIWVEICSEDQEVTAVIHKLKPNYDLILLSNTNQWHFEYAYNRFEVIRLFDKYVLSYNIGCLKPQKEIYESALTLVTNRDKLLYIDDIAEYVEAAQKLGIDSFHFKGAIGLKNYLKENKYL